LTISSKLVDFAGLEFAVSEDIDTIDAEGFSDAIQTVSAKTAKFSGGATMQANSGLRIGMTQLKINTGAEIPINIRTIDIPVPADTTNANDAIDNNTGTFSTTTETGASIPKECLTVDFQSVDTQTLIIRMRCSQLANTATIRVEKSDDNVIYSLVADQIIDANPVNYDFGSHSFKFIRVTYQSEGGPTASNTIELFEVGVDHSAPPTNNVTVRVRSSATIDTANGTVLITDQVMTQNSTLTFVVDLLLTGNGQFVTLEIVSQLGNVIPVNLQEITSIKEV